MNTSLKDRVSLLELPSISRSVTTYERKIATIKDQEIDQIKYILDEIESDSAQVFNQGDTVYVESGMFQQKTKNTSHCSFNILRHDGSGVTTSKPVKKGGQALTLTPVW